MKHPPLPAGNLLAALPAAREDEALEPLWLRPGLRVERIVSDGQTSPAGFWYDQREDEWVLLVQGEADIAFPDGSSVTMRAGDWLALPAGCRHRVARTAVRTVWLAVFGAPAENTARLAGS